LSDPHNDRSQTCNLFTCGGTMISWRSMIKSCRTLSINEVNRECVWLRSLIQQVKENYGLFVNKCDISIQQIRSCENLTDLFTKSLSSRIFEQPIQKVGHCQRLRDSCIVEGRNKYIM
jgi:hypothetical protein